MSPHGHGVPAGPQSSSGFLGSQRGGRARLVTGRGYPVCPGPGGHVRAGPGVSVTTARGLLSVWPSKGSLTPSPTTTSGSPGGLLSRVFRELGCSLPGAAVRVATDCVQKRCAERSALPESSEARLPAEPACPGDVRLWGRGGGGSARGRQGARPWCRGLRGSQGLPGVEGECTLRVQAGRPLPEPPCHQICHLAREKRSLIKRQPGAVWCWRALVSATRPFVTVPCSSRLCHRTTQRPGGLPRAASPRALPSGCSSGKNRVISSTLYSCFWK